MRSFMAILKREFFSYFFSPLAYVVLTGFLIFNGITFRGILEALNSPDAPDVVIALRWSADKSGTGAPGLELCDEASRQPGQGNHGTLSPFDMHNTLVAAGPDLRRGVVSSLPTGNVDIAPTILSIFGIKPPKPMDGRVLNEALNATGSNMPPSKPARLEAKQEHEKFVWQQYLKITKVNGVTYIDEGNGSTTMK